MVKNNPCQGKHREFGCSSCKFPDFICKRYFDICCENSHFFFLSWICLPSQIGVCKSHSVSQKLFTTSDIYLNFSTFHCISECLTSDIGQIRRTCPTFFEFFGYTVVANHVNWHRENLLSDREKTGKPQGI